MDRLALMETFVCVVDTGSFSGAARQLGVGQPAVSKSISQLEERLGVRLLLRSTRGLTPTDAGQGFYDGARRAILEADEADLAARGSKASLSGRLKISAAVTFARLYIVPHLKIFLDQHPQLKIDVMLDDRNIDLLEEGIDISLRMGTLGDSSMTARRIAQGQRIVVGSPGYFAVAGTPHKPAELAAHQMIIYAGPESGVVEFRRGSTEVSVNVEARVRVNAAEGVRAAVLADIGAAVASEWMFAKELQSGEVVRVLEEWELPPVDLWAVYPSGRMANAKARAFVEFVQTIMDGQGKLSG
ncbi:LysR family transcriptional regulator [Undibacterium sp. TJN25]|uniref:LysR family transcriptional regulator n=1 Tax=Undibacterium sp. TJN25 TaxID=3413056 RepID=UPI003BF0DFB1